MNRYWVFLVELLRERQLVHCGPCCRGLDVSRRGRIGSRYWRGGILFFRKGIYLVQGQGNAVHWTKDHFWNSFAVRFYPIYPFLILVEVAENGRSIKCQTIGGRLSKKRLCNINSIRANLEGKQRSESTFRFSARKIRKCVTSLCGISFTTPLSRD